MNCRVCDSTDVELAIDLGMHPWCNDFLRKDQLGAEPFYPLRVVYCDRCATAQLDYTVDKRIMFSDHTYLSGITRSLSDHFRAVADEVDARFLSDTTDKSALDIGSNDGTQLRHFRELGYDVLGVESSRSTARLANEAGIPTLNAFFDLATMHSIGRHFDVINAAGVFFHLEDLHSVCEAIKWGLKREGLFVVQFLYMKSILDNLAFDQIYHEHLLYYTLQTIERLLSRHGLELFDARLDPIHGGSIIGFATHAGRQPPSTRLRDLRALEHISNCNSLSTYRSFGARIERMREDNLAFLDEARQSGQRVFGFGAPVKGNTLLNYFQIGPDRIECLVEKNHLRRGLYSPGMHIPIVLEDELMAIPDVYYVLAWNFRDEILANNVALLDKGVQFYFPIDPSRVA